MSEGECLDGANGHHSKPNPSQVEENAGVGDTHHDKAESRNVVESQVSGSLDKRILDALNTIPPLQQQVIDLTEKLTRMEDTFRRVGMESFIEKLKDQSSYDEKHTSQNGDENPNDTDGNEGRPEGDDTEATKYEDKEDKSSEGEEEVEAGSLAEYKIMHVSPKTDWYMQITKCRTADFRQFAVFVYFEADDDEMNDVSDAHQGEPSDGTLPIRIIINSKRLDTLLEEISGINLPTLPYTALPPFKMFVSLHVKIKSKLQQLEAAFERDFEMTADQHASNMSKPSFEPPATDLSQFSGWMSRGYEDMSKEYEDIMVLRCLVEVSTKYLGSLIDMKSHIDSATLDAIAFKNLWYMYQPGAIIVNRAPTQGKRMETFRVFAVTGGWSKLTEWRSSPLQLHCFNWKFTGSRLIPCERIIKIRPFQGDMKLTDLEYVPKQFLKMDYPALNALAVRGEKFLKSRYGHGRYRGFTSPPEPWHIDEEIFVDFQSAYEYNPKWAEGQNETLSMPDFESEETFEARCSLKGCTSCSTMNIADEKLDSRRAKLFTEEEDYTLEIANDHDFGNLTPEHLVLLPHDLLGYGLKSKKWFRLDVEKFDPNPADDTTRQRAFNNLVLPQQVKDLLQAMVRNHANALKDIQYSDSEDTDGPLGEVDLVQGKGKGLIIFLYGPPGVGKTSTAETIAAWSTPSRPLYPITCGDLGSKPVEIQNNLDSHFKLAHRWNCVLLLDEADVYLAERDIHDLSRNGIVSVFLRNLEYYPGILFLTSNREGMIDEAFKSRIHIALKYNAIDLDGTKQIWRNILQVLQEENLKKKLRITFKELELVQWAEKHFRKHRNKKADSSGAAEPSTATWNGRQIRNAFQTAIALAAYDRLNLLKDEGISEEDALTKGEKYSTIQLSVKHFKKVAKVVDQFEDYLVKCRGDDAVRAVASQLRVDDHLLGTSTDGYPAATVSRSPQQVRNPNSQSSRSDPRMPPQFGSGSPRGSSRRQHGSLEKFGENEDHRGDNQQSQEDDSDDSDSD